MFPCLPLFIFSSCCCWFVCNCKALCKICCLWMCCINKALVWRRYFLLKGVNTGGADHRKCNWKLKKCSTLLSPDSYRMEESFNENDVSALRLSSDWLSVTRCVPTASDTEPLRPDTNNCLVENLQTVHVCVRVGAAAVKPTPLE